jgi:hypothetical protein
MQLLAVFLKNQKTIDLYHIKKIHLLCYSDMRVILKLNVSQFNESSDNCNEIKILFKDLPFTLRGITRSREL